MTAEEMREDLLAKVRREVDAGEDIAAGERLALRHANGQALRVLAGIGREMTAQEIERAKAEKTGGGKVGG